MLPFRPSILLLQPLELLFLPSISLLRPLEPPSRPLIWLPRLHELLFQLIQQLLWLLILTLVSLLQQRQLLLQVSSFLLQLLSQLPQLPILSSRLQQLQPLPRLSFSQPPLRPPSPILIFQPRQLPLILSWFFLIQQRLLRPRVFLSLLLQQPPRLLLSPWLISPLAPWFLPHPLAWVLPLQGLSQLRSFLTLIFQLLYEQPQLHRPLSLLSRQPPMLPFPNVIFQPQLHLQLLSLCVTFQLQQQLLLPPISSFRHPLLQPPLPLF